MANKVDPDQTPCSAASVLGLDFLLKPLCPNICGKYDNQMDLPKLQIYIMCNVTKRAFMTFGQ